MCAGHFPVSVNTNALDRLLWHLMKCLLTHAFRNTSFQFDNGSVRRALRLTTFFFHPFDGNNIELQLRHSGKKKKKNSLAYLFLCPGTINNEG